MQNVEQPVRVLEGDLVARNRIVEVRGSRLLALRTVSVFPMRVAAGGGEGEIERDKDSERGRDLVPNACRGQR